MINTQIALNMFFRQFVPLVFVDGYAMVEDENGNMSPPGEPYITYSYSIGDYSDETLMTVQIWIPNASSFNPALKIASHVKKAIDATIGIKLFVFNLDPITGDKLSNKPKGALQLYRGTPFIQPRPTDDQSLVAYYINIRVINFIK